MKTVKKHIDFVNVGDLILCKDGSVRTLNVEYVKRGGFEGTRIWGDSYACGTQPVEVVVNLN